METIAYTVAGVTTEVSLTALGVGIRVKVEFGTHGESKIVLPLSSLPPEIDPAIPFESDCIIYTGRTAVGVGGTILIQGRRTDNSGEASGEGASQQLVVEDAWYDLRFVTLQAAWANIVGYSGTTPTLGTPFTWPDCVLFQGSPGGPLQPNGSFGNYLPLPVNGHIHSGQAIKEILAYAIFFGGVNLQIGQIDPATYVQFYPVRSMRCDAALKICLRPHPNCACEIDYTTTPPTINIRAQPNLTPLYLPYKSKSGSKTHLTSSVRPRPDLQARRVGIYIKNTTTINGSDVVGVSADIYPPGTPSGLRSLDVSLDMNGPKLAKTVASLTTATFDPTNKNWWAQKVPALKPQSSGGQIPSVGMPGALALLDATVNGIGHTKGIQVVDDSGNAINLANYRYELVSGSQASWMQLAGGGAVNVIEANVVGFFSYWKATTAGAANLVDQIGEHMHTTRVKLTNTPSATFTQSTLLNTGEAYPNGLAQSIYTALATLQYEFTHSVLDSPLSTIIKPGKHALNLTGGKAAWLSMNAMIQRVEMDLMFTPATGVTHSRTTIHCGPVEHLEAGDLFQIFNLFCNRDLSKINPSERTGGSSQGGGQVTLGSESPKENSVPATPVSAVQNISGVDTTNNTQNNLIIHDAPGQSLSFKQFNADGTTNTQVWYPRVFSAAGAPGPTTLKDKVQFIAGADIYFDGTTPSAPVPYLCTTGGDKTSSRWTRFGG